MATFFWYDIMTSDPAGAREFYSKVLGWTAASAEMPDQDYTIFSYNGHSVGGLMPIPDDIPDKSFGAAWRGYIQVSDVDDTAKRIVAAGGIICRTPWDTPGVGKIAVAADPTGAVFLIMDPQPTNPPETSLPPFGSVGTVGWHELHSTDWPAAYEFYREIFAWKKTTTMDMGPLGTYQLFASDSASDIGGMMQKTSNVAAPFWLFYFTVEALTPALQLVSDHGGTVETEPHEVPGPMWIAHCVDPQGGHFSLVSAHR